MGGGRTSPMPGKSRVKEDRISTRLVLLHIREPWFFQGY